MNENWQTTMQNHAKSFHLAALFFPKNVFGKVKALYALCRWIDDAVDTAPNSISAQHRVQQIIQDLRKPQPQMEVNRLYKQNGLNPQYIEDLVDGVMSDIGPVRMSNFIEFRKYCYKVAGVVGLAMADLMDVKEQKARAFAVDLGMAMQITNICRDILEDAKNNRVYLPNDLLAQHEIDQNQLVQLKTDEVALSHATTQMLALADSYYLSARLGYSSIPFRSRGAIIIAEKLYRAIGLKLLKSGARPLQGRTYLTGWEKSYWIFLGLIEWIISPFSQKPTKHNEVLHKGLQPWKESRKFLS